MKAKPIIFNGPMVRALLDGRKTQTRRIIKDIETLPNGMITPKAGYSPRHPESHVSYCPYGQPGDLLWVREKHYIVGEFSQCFYASDSANNYGDDLVWNGPWRPSIHMPRWASRLTLRITNVRVERVQEISGQNCVAEGVCDPIGSPRAYGSITEQFARQMFWVTWDSINAKRGHGWDTNPWVWVIEFEVIHANVDRVMEQAE